MYLNIYMYINDIYSFICYVYSISVFIKHFTHRRRSVVLMSFLYVMMPRIVGTWENRCTSLTWAADGCAGHEPKYRTPRMFKDLGGPLDWWFLTRWTVFSKRRFDFFLDGTHFFLIHQKWPLEEECRHNHILKTKMARFVGVNGIYSWCG